jgi:hypothetical protein
MLVLFDQSTPVPIRPFLREHKVETAWQRGWDKLKSGDLLKAAEEAGFEVLVTPDKNIRYQQNLKNYTIAVVVVGNPQWPALRHHVDRIVAAVNATKPGSYCEVRFRNGEGCLVPSIFGLISDHGASFHHPTHVVDGDIDVRQWIAFHGHQVAKITRSDGAEFLFFAQ